MSINKLKMLGNGPYPLPIDQFFKSVDTFVNSDLCIIATKPTIDFPVKDSHTHYSYEFIIPHSPIPYLSIENKCFSANEASIFPINSGQAHGPHDRMINRSMTVLQVDNNSLNDISYSIFKKLNPCFKHGNYPVTNELKSLIELFIEEYRNNHSSRGFILKNLSIQIMEQLLKQIENNFSSLSLSSYKTDKKYIDNAIEYLRYQYDKDYSLEEAARVAHLSPFHFIRVFKEYTGKTPYEYLLLIKLNKAKELLSMHKYSITEICYMCGFNNLSNFISFFKKNIGVTPSEYRKIMSKK
ncbi:MAG TPA: helix-turn-helix transcriptional regulator [Clostridiaceae bacterium]|nr:helix-turn-helix transcriptional regulator [Clostridiaceae bacterium]